MDLDTYVRKLAERLAVALPGVPAAQDIYARRIAADPVLRGLVEAHLQIVAGAPRDLPSREHGHNFDTAYDNGVAQCHWNLAKLSRAALSQITEDDDE